MPEEVRPSARTPEFDSYFENVVKTSNTVGEAVSRLGYAPLDNLSSSKEVERCDTFAMETQAIRQFDAPATCASGYNERSC